ncbi:hypothetical protein JCM10207_002682 [Rhodosporidiobolus poonsookiae]
MPTAQTPAGAAPLVSTVRHDIYPSISPEHALKDAAKGLSVLVTGSGRGIGEAEALAFARAGAKKVVLTSRSKEQLDEVKQKLIQANPETEVLALEADATAEASVDKLFEQAGELDILVCNAGYLEPIIPVRDSSPTEWRRSLDVNLFGTYLATRAFLRAAHARGAIVSGKKLSILLTSSLGSTLTMLGMGGYQSFKSAINRFAEFVHFEEPGVRVFVFHPASTVTKLTIDSIPSEYHGLLDDTPLLPAGFAVWLATQNSADFLRGRYISANWDVDEVLAKKNEIIEKNLLWTRVVGQEQVMRK